jgi:hypothetical protein
MDRRADGVFTLTAALTDGRARLAHTHTHTLQWFGKLGEQAKKQRDPNKQQRCTGEEGHAKRRSPDNDRCGLLCVRRPTVDPLSPKARAAAECFEGNRHRLCGQATEEATERRSHDANDSDTKEARGRETNWPRGAGKGGNETGCKKSRSQECISPAM